MNSSERFIYYSQTCCTLLFILLCLVLYLLRFTIYVNYVLEKLLSSLYALFIIFSHCV